MNKFEELVAKFVSPEDVNKAKTEKLKTRIADLEDTNSALLAHVEELESELGTAEASLAVHEGGDVDQRISGLVIELEVLADDARRAGSDRARALRRGLREIQGNR